MTAASVNEERPIAERSLAYMVCSQIGCAIGSSPAPRGGIKRATHAVRTVRYLKLILSKALADRAST